MPEYHIEGPDQDGNYWYRGWQLERKPCARLDCGCGQICWCAYPLHELNNDAFDTIALAIGLTNNPPIDYLQRLVTDDPSSLYPRIEDCIDAVEAEVERQFRANLAAALKGH